MKLEIHVRPLLLPEIEPEGRGQHGFEVDVWLWDGLVATVLLEQIVAGDEAAALLLANTMAQAFRKAMIVRD